MRLDTTIAPELENFLTENLLGVTELINDFVKTNYTSSAGLRVLLATHKKMNVALKFTNLCEIVMEVLEMMVLVNVLTTE